MSTSEPSAVFRYGQLWHVNAGAIKTLLDTRQHLAQALDLATATIKRLADTPAKLASVQGTLSVAQSALAEVRS